MIKMCFQERFKMSSWPGSPFRMNDNLNFCVSTLFFQFQPKSNCEHFAQRHKKPKEDRPKVAFFLHFGLNFWLIAQ